MNGITLSNKNKITLIRINLTDNFNITLKYI